MPAPASNSIRMKEAALTEALENMVSVVETYFDDDFSSADAGMTHDEAERIVAMLIREHTERLAGYQLYSLLWKIRRGNGSRQRFPSFSG